MGLLIGLIFLGVFAVAVLVMMAAGSGASEQAKQVHATLDSALATDSPEVSDQRVNLRKDDLLSSIPWLNRKLLQFDIAPRLQTLLYQADSKWTAGVLLAICGLCFVVGFMLIDLRFNSFLAACPVGLLLLAGWLRMLRGAPTRAITARVGVSRPGQSMIAVSAAAAVPSLVGLWPPHGHYAAPATGAFILIGLVGLRRLRTAKVRGAKIGLALSRAVVILLAVALLAATSAKTIDPFALNAAAANSPLPLRIERERMQSQLSRLPGQHLVIVFYAPTDVPSEEWIDNQPDPAAAKIIWARDMGREQNAELIRYFHDRRIWLAEPDLTPPPLLPYRAE